MVIKVQKKAVIELEAGEIDNLKTILEWARQRIDDKKEGHTREYWPVKLGLSSLKEFQDCENMMILLFDI